MPFILDISPYPKGIRIKPKLERFVIERSVSRRVYNLRSRRALIVFAVN
jgi:hypothetical protein